MSSVDPVWVADACTDAGRAVRVLVADDHPAMRGALARIVREHDGLDLVAEASDGEEARRLIAQCAPDVALLDVRMPVIDGLAVLRELRKEGSPVRVLLISGNDDSEIAHEAISQGAAGFLSKDANEREIATALVDVAEGRSVLSPTLQSGVLDLIRQRSGTGIQLSRREQELLTLAAEGLTTFEIAEHLHLSANTVKTYWQRLYDKLGTNDRASAVAEAMRRGLLQ